MKRSVRLLATTIVLLVSTQAFAYFADIGRDARARGMANAMVSIYGDVHSIHYNPAGTARTKNLEVNMMWGKPLTVGDLNDGSSFNNINASVLMPFTNDVNLSWLIRWIFYGLTFGNEDFMFKNGAMGISFERADVAGLTSETFITLNYSKVMDDVIFHGAKLSFGFNFDFYMIGFTKTADWATLPDNPKDSVFTMGIDFGVIYDFSKTIRLGFVMENLLKPNYSVFDGGEDYSPTNIKVGGSMFFSKLLFFENLTMSLNYVTYGKYDANDNTATESTWHYGFESWWFENMFAFRGGVMIGSEDNSEISTGLTFLLVMGDHAMSIDYAFTLPLGVTGTRHLLSVTWKWQQPRYAFEYDKKKAAEMKRIDEQKEKLRKQQEAAKKKKDKETKTNP